MARRRDWEPCVSTAIEFFTTARAVRVLALKLTAPRNFTLELTQHAQRDLILGGVQYVGWRFGALTEAFRLAIRRGDGVAVEALAQGIFDLYCAFADHSDVHDGDLSDDLQAQLGRAGDEGLRYGSEEDFTAVGDLIQRLAHEAVIRGRATDAAAMIDALLASAMSAHQISEGTTNVNIRAAVLIAVIEADAEESLPEVAAYAIAGWASAVSYVMIHHGRDHPLLELSHSKFGDDPPWDGAIQRLGDKSWLERWANKLEAGIAHPIGVVLLARDGKIPAQADARGTGISTAGTSSLNAG